jgi:hypothetical protein
MHCRKGIHLASQDRIPFRFHVVMVFGCKSVTFVRALNLYGLFASLISHTASALHIFSAPRAAIKKVCLSQSVAYTFPLPCGGGPTCWRLPSLNTELMLCFTGTCPKLIQICHAKHPMPELRPVLHTPGRIHGKRMAQGSGAELITFSVRSLPA